MEVSDIVKSVDIVEYIGQFADLEQRSDGEYWALSPLKSERTPSFSINPAKQQFYDFSTGCGGSVIEFIERYYNCNFPKALDILKKYANITENVNINTDRLVSAGVARRYRKRDDVAKILPCSPLDSDYMDRFERNYEKLQPWMEEGISKEVLDSYDVRFDSFSNRIVFPVKDISGNIVNVCGRTLDKDYKEKNIRKYTYFSKWGGTMNAIYGLYENMEAIKSKKEIILFEGAKSVMIASTWGIHNAGAIMTSHLNPGQFCILIKLGVRVVFALDKEVDISKDTNIRRLTRYVCVENIRDEEGFLDAKMAPVDEGKVVWDTLYKQRHRIN